MTRATDSAVELVRVECREGRVGVRGGLRFRSGRALRASGRPPWLTDLYRIRGHRCSARQVAHGQWSRTVLRTKAGMGTSAGAT